MRITRRHLRLTLAALWLFDGALQCQPFMFSRGFARTIIAPAGMGLPALVAVPIHWTATLVGSHAAVTNGGIAAVQILLGLGLLLRRHARVALGASIAWALSIWLVGEGLGGIASGGTLLTGAPGAALLYAVIAAVAWPTSGPESDERPSRLAIPAWCVLWLSGAGLQLDAEHEHGASLSGTFHAAASSSPEWIAGVDRQFSALHFTNATSPVVIALFVLVALWSLMPGWSRVLSAGIGVALALAAWVLLQGLGDLTSGQATDPNSGPLIVLLAVAVVGAAPLHETAQRRVRDAAIAPTTLDTRLIASFSTSSSQVAWPSGGR